MLHERVDITRGTKILQSYIATNRFLCMIKKRVRGRRKEGRGKRRRKEKREERRKGAKGRREGRRERARERVCSDKEEKR